MSGNEPAFPASTAQHIHANGLTKRELFAAMALQGLLANPKSEPEDVIHNQIIAARNADGLIEQLGRPQ